MLLMKAPTQTDKHTRSVHVFLQQLILVDTALYTLRLSEIRGVLTMTSWNSSSNLTCEIS